MTSQPWIHRSADILPGALIQLQWSHDLSAMDTVNRGVWAGSGSFCFNGAMTSQPWILSNRVAKQSKIEKLQWSHDLSAMDTSAHKKERKQNGQSFNGAMTSQPWILLLAAGTAAGTAAGFNGAMTSQPWIRQSTCEVISSVTKLQWSHDLSAMDTRQPGQQRRGGAYASMEP